MQTLHNRTGRAHAAGVNNRKSRKKNNESNLLRLKQGCECDARSDMCCFLILKSYRILIKQARERGIQKRKGSKTQARRGYVTAGSRSP